MREKSQESLISAIIKNAGGTEIVVPTKTHDKEQIMI